MSDILSHHPTIIVTAIRISSRNQSQFFVLAVAPLGPGAGLGGGEDEAPVHSLRDVWHIKPERERC